MPARSTGLWVLTGILLVLAAVPPLLVPLYSRTTPTLWGFPFFFWFQFLLVLWAALMTSTAYFLAKEAFRRDRSARTGAHAGPQAGSQGGAK